MRILQVTNFFKPIWGAGGVVKVSYEISKQLTKRGHHLTVYTTNYRLNDMNLETNKLKILEGMDVYYFENLRKFFPIKIPPIPYYLPFIIKKEIAKFDVIHIHEYRTFLAIIVHYYAKKHNIPYIVQAHGSVLPHFKRSFFKKIFDFFFINILKDASKVIALSQDEVDQYKIIGVSSDKIEIVPNGIDLDEYTFSLEKGSFKRKYGIKNDEKCILFLGRLNKIKGVELLINSFVLLKKELEKVKLIISGPDSGCLKDIERSIIEHQMENEIILTGPIYNYDKISAYNDADIYVLPSSYETFPNTVLEACACGTPVIVTNGCGIRDLVDKKVGYVVEYDETSLKDAMLQLLVSDKDRDDFGLQCEYFVKNFEWDLIISRFENIYLEIIDGDI